MSSRANTGRAPLRAVAEPDGDSSRSRAPITVVLADDHAFVRHTLRMVLDGETGIDVVAEAGDSPTVMRHVREYRPHVLVLDPAIADGSGVGVVRRLRSEAPDTAIVATTMSDDPRRARALIAAGASGYVLKQDAATDLPHAVRRAAAGDSFITARVALELRAEAEAYADELSAQDMDVLRLIARSRTDAKIGELLQISLGAVEARRAQIHRKLGLATRAELVHYALRRELLGGAPTAPSTLTEDS